MNQANVILLLNYARSGGTLLNRCLGSFRDTLVFSEINPEATWLTEKNKISRQAAEWYNLEIAQGTFLEEVRNASRLCSQIKKRLIIRDFSYGSFVPRSYNSYNPSEDLKTLTELQTGQIPVTPFAFVRNAKDVWLSMRDSTKDFHDKNLNGLYKFTEKIIENRIKIFKYEDFCLNPAQEMKKICAYTNLNYTDSFLEDFVTNLKVTGDINQMETSRGFTQNKILLLKRRQANKEDLLEIKTQTLADQINHLLAYED